MKRVFTTTFLATAMAALLLTANASAALIISTDFTSGEGFSAGNLQFQNGWVGQAPPQVDPTGSGVVNSSGAFIRNLHNAGAFGSTAGSGTDGVGPGPSLGDKINIEMEYKFTLDGRFNRPLNRTGVRQNFSTGGFDASPTFGMKSFYSEFQSSSGGALKLFGNIGRNGFAGADNAFALITSGLSIGLDPDGTVGPADLESDLLRYSLEMTYIGGDTWQTSALTLSNVTAGNTVLLDAAADKPAILTETQTVAANEFYLASAWTDSAIATSTDSISFSYTAVPEPTSLVLLGLASMSLMGVRRR